MKHGLIGLMKTMVLSVFCFSLVPTLAWASYQYTELLPPGADYADAIGINLSGQVIGQMNHGDKGYLFAGTNYTILLPPGCLTSQASAINNAGDIVGQGSDGTTTKGFLYTKGNYIEIMPPGWVSSYTSAINDNGDIVGWGFKSSSDMFHTGFLYSKGNYIELLPTGWLYAYPKGINNNGDVIGGGCHDYAYFGDSYCYGFLYSGGNYTELQQLTTAEDINNNGEIVGTTGSAGPAGPAGFLYSGGTWTKLLPEGWSSSWCNSLNDTGDVVGFGFGGKYGSFNSTGFVYSGGKYTELTAPGWIYSAALGINNNGDIVGLSYDGTIYKGFIARINEADHFTWPVDPLNLSNGHYGKCREWGKLSDGCYWLSDTSEDRAAVWIDVQPFQRHKWQGHGFHLGADYNFGQEPFDQGKPVYPVAKGIIPLGGVKTNQCGFGNIIFVKHDTSFGTYTSMYAHVGWLASGPPKEGDTVSPDSPIAKIGNGYWNNRSCSKQKTGVWPYHLHFELREGDNIVNGLAYTGYKVDKGPQGQIDPNAFISTHR